MGASVAKIDNGIPRVLIWKCCTKPGAGDTVGGSAVKKKPLAGTVDVLSSSEPRGIVNS